MDDFYIWEGIYMTSGIYDLEDEVGVAPEELESIFKW